MNAVFLLRCVPVIPAQKKGAFRAPFGLFLVRSRGQAISMTASISTSAPFGRAATPMAARAG